MGGEKDDSGNQLYPEEVSTFKIPSDQAVHLKTGFRWLKNNKAWLVSVGYGIPFNGYKAEVISSGSMYRWIHLIAEKDGQICLQ
jgi:hypothetical protein